MHSATRIELAARILQGSRGIVANNVAAPVALNLEQAPPVALDVAIDTVRKHILTTGVLTVPEFYPDSRPLANESLDRP